MGRKNEYDGLEEYLVVVKESGQREVQKSQEEIHRKEDWSRASFKFLLLTYMCLYMHYIYW